MRPVASSTTRDEPFPHRALEGAASFVNGGGLAGVDQRALERGVEIFQERDHVVVPEDGADARRPAAEMIPVQLAQPVRDRGARAPVALRYV